MLVSGYWLELVELELVDLYLILVDLVVVLLAVLGRWTLDRVTRSWWSTLATVLQPRTVWQRCCSRATLATVLVDLDLVDLGLVLVQLVVLVVRLWTLDRVTRAVGNGAAVVGNGAAVLVTGWTLAGHCWSW